MASHVLYPALDRRQIAPVAARSWTASCPGSSASARRSSPTRPLALANLGDKVVTYPRGFSRRGREVREEDEDPHEFLEHAPELTDALQRGCHSFQCFALASFFARGEFQAEEHEREICRRAVPELLKNFEEKHGSIRMAYFRQEAFAAAVLTENDEIGVVYGPEEHRAIEATELLFECESLSYQSFYRLDGGDRRLCQTMIFAIIMEVLRRLDAPTGSVEAAGPEPIEARQEAGLSPFAFLRKELEQAEAFLLRSARRRAQLVYLRWMVIGGLALGFALVALAAVASTFLNVPGAILRALVLSLAAGALGAVVSVLSRTTFGEFELDLLTIEAGDDNLRLLGGLRPVVGAIFGAASYVLIASTLLPVEPRPDGSNVTYVYVAVAFLAGFSERFAQDMFIRSGRAVSEPQPH